MAIPTVRNLPDEVNRDLRVRVGDALAAIGRRIGLTNDELDGLEQARDKRPAEPLSFD